MLILEGADLTGKTTLARTLASRLEEQCLGHMRLHLTRPPKDFDFYRGHVDKISRDVIWDRFHMSMLAYRRHDEYPSDLTPLKYSLVDAAVRLIGGFTVVLTADTSVIESRWANNKKQELYDLPHVLDVNATYGDIASGREVTVRGQTYRPDVDYWVHVTDPAIGVKETVVREILDAYIARYEAIDQL